MAVRGELPVGATTAADADIRSLVERNALLPEALVILDATQSTAAPDVNSLLSAAGRVPNALSGRFWRYAAARSDIGDDPCGRWIVRCCRSDGPRDEAHQVREVNPLARLNRGTNQLPTRPRRWRVVGVSRNRLRASAGFELFLGVQRQLDHALEQLIGR